MDALAIIAVLVTVLFLVISHLLCHYIFQVEMWDIGKYVVGTGIIWAGFLVWALPSGNTSAALVLSAIIGVGGAAIIGLHLLKMAMAGQGWRRVADAHEVSLREVGRAQGE